MYNNDFLLANIDSMEGHDFEYWSAEMLQNQGFQNVEVTQASGDQGVDILAEKDGIRYAIQCKCYSSNLGNTPVQEVHAGKQMYHCHVGVVLTNRYFTEGAKQLAEATGTLLWDRDYIINYLSHFQNALSYTGTNIEDSFPDELIQKAIQVILETNQASVSMLERRLGLGYVASVRLIDQLESMKVIGPFIDGKPRKILVKNLEKAEQKKIQKNRLVHWIIHAILILVLCYFMYMIIHLALSL